ncbi:MAG: hypothetical protein AAGD06_23140 [Acidobacteriota bacterium]
MKHIMLLATFLVAGSNPLFAGETSAAFELDLTSVSELEFSDGNASIDLQSAQASFELGGLSLSVGIHDFDWTGAESLDFANGSVEPWEQVKTASLRYTFNRPISPSLFFTSSFGAGLSFEEESSDSLSADTFAAVIWNRSADWAFLFGAGYAWHAEVDLEFEVFPALGFTYRGQAEDGLSASLGIPETSLRYRFSPRTALSAGVGVRSFVNRLADDSAVSAAGYAEFIQFDVGLYFEHRFGDHIELRVGPSYGVEGELRIHDSEGVLLSEHDLESALGVGLKLRVAF